jgi:three-Cys-motif partner protein
MAPRKPRLFDPRELGPREDPKRTRRPHLHLADAPSEQMALNPDGAGLVPDRTDGLPVRLVKPHSAGKARTVSRDLGTVGRAMGNKWFPVHYLELFCGPGYLLDDVTHEEVPGSPLQALGIQRPFDNYVFSDFSDVCAHALERRIAAMRREGIVLPPTTVLQGDANDVAHLERVCSLIDPRALVIAYLDPAKPNLDWTTVEYLANRFRFIDFLINLPFSGIHRSLTAGGTERPRLMLNHPDPMQLVHPEEGAHRAEHPRALRRAAQEPRPHPHRPPVREDPADELPALRRRPRLAQRHRGQAVREGQPGAEGRGAGDALRHARVAGQRRRASRASPSCASWTTSPSSQNGITRQLLAEIVRLVLGTLALGGWRTYEALQPLGLLPE